MTLTDDNTPSRTAVLYVDYKGNANPLSTTYLPTAARHFSSSSYNFSTGKGTTTVTEVDAAYCPQCLSFYDPTTAMDVHRGMCPNVKCRNCPVCTNPLSMRIVAATGNDGTSESDPSECVFKCSYCKWSSLECGGLVAKSTSSDEDMKSLYCKMTEQVISKDCEVDGMAVFDKLKRGWGKRLASINKAYTVREKENINHGPWSLAKLEKSLEERRISTLKGSEIFVDSESNEKDIPSNIRSCRPQPMPLRVKKSRRCKKELENGRPGILVKPKVNPLEGDSSLRSGHGQWFKKDSSAIHMFPNVEVVRHTKITDPFSLALLVRVKNPTLGRVKFRFGCSNEIFPNKDDSSYIDNILIDPYRRIFVDATLLVENDPSSKIYYPTDFAMLEACEDVILDINKIAGTGNEKDIERVWDGNQRLRDAQNSCCKLVAQSKDTAWFEIIMLNAVMLTQEEEDKSPAYAITMPICTEIEIGGDSWQSSLVKPLKDNEVDFASFWLRFVLPKHD